MPGEGRTPRAVWVLVTAQFGVAFSMNYVFVFLPFYIRAVSDLSEAATLFWTGLIVGGAPATAFFASPAWGRLTSRVSPKRIFERGLLSHSIVIALTAFTTSLPLLLCLRLVQGVLGGISTIALIIVGALSRREALSANIGLLNTAMTTGTIAGPPVGAAVAAAVGFRAAFLSAAVLIVASLLFSVRFLPPIPPQTAGPGVSGVSRRDLLVYWLVSAAATIQIVFLAAVLPQVLIGFGIAGDSAVATAGFVVMAYGSAAALAGVSLRWVSGRSPRRFALLAGLGAAVLQASLALAGNLPVFLLLRCAQTFLAALLIPLLMAEVAATGRGSAVGTLNTARFFGNATGPILATNLAAAVGVEAIYLTISLLTVGALAAFAAAGPQRGGRPGPGASRAAGGEEDHAVHKP